MSAACWRQGGSVWVALAPPSRGRVTVARAYDFGGCVEWLAEPRRVLPVESGLLRVKRGDAADSHAFPCRPVEACGDLPDAPARGFVPDSADAYSPEPIPS